ncbi:MAG TPA: hypothetical protein ENH94_06800 [Phycisphaerales bacterium]|nr:hypothetical protein [Phycisphaerales bacterium]
MDEDKKQKIMIGLIVGCMVLAGIITVVTNLGKGGGRGKRPTGPVTMLCINNKCNADFELSQEELAEQMNQMGDNDFMMMQTPKFVCSECNNRSAYRAMICGECDTMFIPMQNNDFRDRCPDCGYSKTEERKNAAK